MPRTRRASGRCWACRPVDAVGSGITMVTQGVVAWLAWSAVVVAMTLWLGGLSGTLLRGAAA